ncbi:topoisomerase IV, partial [Ruminococcaceae bacterium OttesenSCG-928-O06]|nr:topoisomerase IV [Ruminococcaceae bacterium OttesenSCG-928-O06]
MIGFGIDKAQAEYVAEIRLRNLNREYILRRTEEIAGLEADIAELEATLKSPAKVRKVIIDELTYVSKKYGQPRKSEILYGVQDEEAEPEEDTLPDYPVHVFFTNEGYFKKITPASLRMSSEQKLKEGDVVAFAAESHNTAEALFFTNKHQVYKTRVGDFEDTKASVMGEYLPARLAMEDGEVPLCMVLTDDYTGFMLFLFQNGKGAKVPLQSYATKQNRKKLINAYSDKAPLAWMAPFTEESEIAIQTSGGRMLLVATAQISAKTTKNTAGVGVINLKKGQRITQVRLAASLELKDPHRYRVRSLPAAGAVIRADDFSEQTMLGEENAPE